ncbi:hypothetical protein CC85DRAFT_285943 [Cutaneotrichosporon oleaginosum]|uniref:Uncharacterized protein n=1 Tax=Cutaneotrichosporon oleaginosum TaxID=879819 RepID=A0A0J0XLN8_9TREE|nr:uncharacterized protein CC85DRAFT_285943 [Cutaneotrichosporon oleaginosum]KLT42012.1 hypothetical protein CC85DRAFT_285943 [Cutaneotrichosporon oleaginosum]TXT14331.1 hypothetical protein COLE_00524 [Cutaneotrichosporon oleaginosum]
MYVPNPLQLVTLIASVAAHPAPQEASTSVITTDAPAPALSSAIALATSDRFATRSSALPSLGSTARFSELTDISTRPSPTRVRNLVTSYHTLTRTRTLSGIVFVTTETRKTVFRTFSKEPTNKAEYIAASLELFLPIGIPGVVVLVWLCWMLCRHVGTVPAKLTPDDLERAPRMCESHSGGCRRSSDECGMFRDIGASDAFGVAGTSTALQHPR